MASRVSTIRPADLVPLAWGSLRRNKLRSFLTVGAIGFGVAVMVYLLSLGMGLEELSVGKVLKSNTLLSLKVSSFDKTIKPLTPETVEEIVGVPSVTEVLPKLSVKGQISLAKVAAVSIIGVDSSYFDVTESESIVAGKAYTEGETGTMLVTTAVLKAFDLDQNKTPLLTFGLQLGADYGTSNQVSDVVVRGVIKNDTALSIYLPRDYLESLIKENKPNYDEITAIVTNAESISPASEAIRGLGYKVTAVVETVDQIKRVFSIVQIILTILGSIALIVASIGMFNTLTVSLLERTREIGIMKALGMKKIDVKRLFITEALLIGLLGGIGGIFLALGLQQLTIIIFQILATLAQGSVPQLFINVWYLPLAAMAFSLLIALTTGFYPATRAAKLSALSAIRYE